MTGVGGAPPGPAPTPVEVRGRRPSGWVALGLFAAALVALVGLSLVGQSGGRPGYEAAVASPVAASSPTASPAPPLGTPPPRAAVSVGPLATCSPGSTPDEPGPIDQARPNQIGSMAFDRRAGRLVAIAETGTGVETWTFDVCTNTWMQMHPDREPPGVGGLVYDVDSDVTILVFRDPDDPFDPDPSPGAVRVWAYDLQADTWTEKGAAPTDAVVSRAYDPVSGFVVAGPWGATVAWDDLWEYDVESDAWTPIHLTKAPEGYGPFAYDASVDRIVMAGGSAWAETWLLDLRTGRWSVAGAEAPNVIEVFTTWPSIVYDEAAERTVLIGDVPRLAAYDATADRWEMLAGADPDRAVGFQLHAAYDPVNGRLVGWQPADVEQDVLFALDLVTREWTTLLEPEER